jgi:hypothetical protein
MKEHYLKMQALVMKLVAKVRHPVKQAKWYDSINAFLTFIRNIF